jgi:FkbM family methyltransferase
VNRIRAKIQHYYSALGFLGVAAFLYAKLSGKRPLFKTRVYGIRHPVYIRIGTTDLSVLKQVLIERHYDFWLPINPTVIVDAGANIGLSAVFFANKYPNANVFALEPEEANFKLLERNVSAYPQIKAVRAALWSENKQICLVDPGVGEHGFQTLDRDSGKCQHRGLVPAITLDNLMRQAELRQIDVLKIDIEGAEKEVFRTSATWKDKVAAIMVELHDSVLPGCREAFLEATKEFSRRFGNGEILTCLRSELLVPRDTLGAAIMPSLGEVQTTE